MLGGMIFLLIINNCFSASAGDESQILEIEDVILHPTYDPFKAYQDIAVIKLKPNISMFINIIWQKHKKSTIMPE